MKSGDKTTHGLLFFGWDFSGCLHHLFRNLAKSFNPVAGMITLSRRPLTSSVMRRKRPRGFSFNVKMKVFPFDLNGFSF
jgi:hypothetical protein